jgi:hypothetical protein
VPASPGEVVGGSLVLLVALVPTGLALLRVVERLLGHRFPLSLPERLLIAFYAAGAFLFVIASIPVPVYGASLIAIVLVGGAVVYALFAVAERGRGLRSGGAFVLTPTGAILGLGFLGLLTFEVLPVWSHPFPNAWDGSVTALWTNLILRQGTLPTTLAPFASAPVVYPLATTVWMTVPVLILGWSVVQAPVLLPPLFLSLTVPAAYAWGARWGATTSASGSTVGLLFAAFFGLVASWPRLYTGGSYDFAFALPLFLVTLGLLPAFVRGKRHRAGRLIAFGMMAGVLATLSLTAGEAVLVLLLAYHVTAHRATWVNLLTALGRTAIVAVFELAFLARSLFEWWGNARPSYAPASEYGNLNSRLIEGELDPFVLWKFKVSPFPWMSVELQVLLAAGLLLGAWIVFGRPGGLRRFALSRFASDLLVGTVAMFGLTAVLLLSALPGAGGSGLRSFTNLDQSSVLLFVFFEAACAFPLVIVLVHGMEPRADRTSPPVTPAPRAPPLSSRKRTPPNRRRAIVGALAVLVIVVPLASGAWSTVAQGPGFIQQNVGKTSNVTAGDVLALRWVGSHLPTCSAVLVAPGSAGQFLPEYASVRLVFPMNPIPSNSSYAVAVADLVAGVYDNQTRSALLDLGVTEVFVTGQTSVSFPAIPPGPLGSSPDFSLLTQSGDAVVFGFTPGESAEGCSA